MKAFRLVLLSLAVLCAALGGAIGDVTDVSSSSTADSSTTTSPTASTTVTSASTLVPTSDSGTSSETTVHTTDHTTAHTQTTTSNPVTSTVIPSTTAATPQDIWTAANGNHTCILLQATFSMTFKYNNTADKVATTKVEIKKPPNSEVHSDGDCNLKDEQSINLKFFKHWVLTLNFTKKNTSYSLSNVNLEWDLNSANISDAPLGSNGSYSHALNIETNKDGYMCLAMKPLFKNESIVPGLTELVVHDLRFEAFQQKTSPVKFGDSYSRCSEDNISNLVPIIVGACLGGLIVIVLIAYLIGRRRSRRGYESV